MAAQNFPSFQGKDQFDIVPHDTNNLEIDTTNNPQGYKYALIHNAGASAAFEVIAAGSKTNTAIGIYIVQGGTHPVPVKRVLATGSPASGIVGIV
jgi:hypothetical protein